MIKPADQTAETIHIICAADANYGPYAGITMSSVVQSNPGESIHLHLLSDGVLQADLDRFQDLAKNNGCQFTSYDVTPRLNAAPRFLQMANHLSRAAYARLFLSDFLPTSVKRILYLDCDVVCIGSLRELWAQRTDLKLVAAVRDVWLDHDVELKRFLNIPDDVGYYNSGVLFINLEEWRSTDVSGRLLAYLSGPRGTKHADQDVINAVLWEGITEISTRWNCLVSLPKVEESRRQREQACILHYVGGFKPWHFGYRVVIRTDASEFRKAKTNSPWRWVLPDFHVQRIRKKLKQFIRKGLTSRVAVAKP